jgi:outer membrane protein TolC
MNREITKKDTLKSILMVLLRFMGIFLHCILFSTVLIAQPTANDTISVLTLEEAISLALQNNESIKVEKQNVATATNNAIPANAGLLPTISLNAQAQFDNNESDLTIRTFQENPTVIRFEESGVQTRTIGSQLSINYMVLGGFSGTYRYQILKEAENTAKAQQAFVINQLVLNISELFLEIAKLQSREELLQNAISTTKDRIQKTQDRFNFGTANKLSVLQATTDLNSDLSALDRVLLVKNNLKRDLNYLIGYDAERKYRVVASYNLPSFVELEDVKAQILANNAELKLVQRGEKISDLEIGIAKSQLLPQIQLSANYGVFNQENDLQQLAEITNIGYSVGASIRWNIFDGKQTKTRIQNAKVARKSSEYLVEQTQRRLFTIAVKERNRLDLLEDQRNRELTNLSTFEESYSRVNDQYEKGQATNLDVRAAQNALLNAQIILEETKADIIISSLRLQALSGQLLKM